MLTVFRLCLWRTKCPVSKHTCIHLEDVAVKIMRARCDSLHHLEWKCAAFAICKWFPKKHAGLLISHLPPWNPCFVKD